MREKEGPQITEDINNAIFAVTEKQTHSSAHRVAASDEVGILNHCRRQDER